MSLLPNRFQIVNDMPSLGALVKEAIQPKPCPIEAFEIHSVWNECVQAPDGFYTPALEEDCRQIKKKPRSEDALIKALTDCYITGNGAALIRYAPVKVEVFTKPVTIYQPPPSPAVVDGNPIPGLDEAIARQHNAAYFMWGVA